jgi:hypothetical protein
MTTKYYRVGDHDLSITFADSYNGEDLIPSFRPFAAEIPTGPLLFNLTVDDRFRWRQAGHEIGHFDNGNGSHGVYRTADGTYHIEVTDVEGTLCVLMQASPDFRQCRAALMGMTWEKRNFGLNNALMMAYAFASANQQTLLVHASVIRCQGHGYLMTAPSGTGKSTHTRLWYDNIPGCDLMNDDNPVVHIVDGQARVYGSPWSGKTPCYRNVQAPIGAFVRIQQRPENSIRPLRPLEGYSVLLPAVSSMTWDARVHKGVCDTIAELLRLCPVYELGCLPDAAAAHLCHDTVVR